MKPMKRFKTADYSGNSDTLLEAIEKSRPIDLGGAALQARLDSVREIVETVKAEKDAAIRVYTEKFDGVDLKPDQFEVTPEEIEAAVASVEPELVAILQRAYDNIRRFHEKNLRESWEEVDDDETILGQRITPIERVGVYVPGGTAFYPSSVLMNIAPARVAGVPEIVMVSPPSYKGTIHPVALAAARIAGATQVFRIGGAHAIAALAYGTDTIDRVSKITGPGNAIVTAAKALVRSVVEIDNEAGPSEVVVIADDKADPAFVAYELLAQAEHDGEAVCVLITPSEALADAVEQRIKDETEQLSRREFITWALEGQGAIVLTKDLDEAVAISNLLAPEHLSIQTAEPHGVAGKIKNAGAIMIGAMTPVAVGDYYAGPNHILPTGRRARFSSPLTAEDFRKVTSILSYSEKRLRRDAEDIVTLAKVEGLTAHARSVEVRLK